MIEPEILQPNLIQIELEDLNIQEGMNIEATPIANESVSPPTDLNIQVSANGSVMSIGNLQSTNFKAGSDGWRLDSNGNIEANDGNFRGDITGASGTFSGTISATLGLIGAWTISALALYHDGATDAVSAGMSPADYPFYAGKKYADRATAPFRVTPAGAFVTSNITITGLQAGSEIAIQGWSHNIIFSVTDADTVAWSSGTITLMNGDTQVIDAGNTGNMSAENYLYVVWGNTTLQKSTTKTDAVGSGKIMIAICENATGEAIFKVFGSTEQNIDAGVLRAASITVTEIANGAIEEAKVAADAITATKIAVSGLDGDSGDVAANHIIAGMIQTNAITSIKINANAVTATKINVVGLNGATGRIVVADATDANVVTGGINTHAVTLIEAGKIVISGATNLDDWRKTGDLTNIDGGSISTRTIAADRIVANAITANEIAANTITSGEITTGELITLSAQIKDAIIGDVHITGKITVTHTDADVTADNETFGQESDINVLLTTNAPADASATIGGIFGTNISGGGSGNNQVGNDGYITTITDTAITVTNLAAINADIGSITAGDITLDTSGFIRGGQTAYNTGTGFFLGYDTDAYKFSIGNGINYFNWDGTNMILKAILKLLGTLELKSYTVVNLPTISGNASSPGTMSEVVRTDTPYYTEWFNENNAKLSDDTYSDDGDQDSNWWDFQVKLVKGGTITGDNKAIQTALTITDTYISYGASDNLWGTSLTPSDINASDFGFVFTVYYLKDETVVGTTVNAGSTSVILDDASGYNSGGGWARITDDGANEMLVLYTGISTNTLTGIPASGDGSITATATAGNSAFEIKPSNFLKATNFGFTIPTNSTINGVVCEAEVNESAASNGSAQVDHMRITVYYSDNINPVLAGSTAYASNGRKAGEGAGNGSGVLVFSDGDKWIASDTGAEVLA